MAEAPRPGRVQWPDGKTFAFTVFDDTDHATVANVAPVYDFLESIGMRTTKSVWTITGVGVPRIDGATCDDPDYRAWTLDLQSRGFEIGSHGATYVTSARAETERSLDRFREIYGHDPMAMANHSGCAEAIYWGADRLTGFNRLAYNVMTRFRNAGAFRGHRDGDPLFWGDLCRDRIRYVRNFTYADLDTLAACPVMPYHDPERPYVNRWFASSEGRNVEAFTERIADDAQDRLERAGGASIMYTHFASGFYRDGKLDPTFRERMERLAARNGWFVPVTQLLDHIAASRTRLDITGGERSALERRWLRSKIRIGPS